VDALGSEDVATDQLNQRHQRGGAGADPIRQGRGVELDAFPGVARALPVERLVLAELGVQDHRQQARSGACPSDRMEWRWRLGDRLAAAAGELLPDGLDYLPLSRHHLQRLGNVFAQFGELAAAARAGARRGDHHPLARQMRRQRRAHRLPTGEADHRCGVGRDDGCLVLGGTRLQLLELQLHLIEQVLPAFRRLPKPVALHLGDQELQMRHHGLGAGSAGFSLLAGRALGRECCPERVDLVWRRHGPDCRTRCNRRRAAESNRRSLSRPPPDASFAPDCASQCPQACRPAELR